MTKRIVFIALLLALITGIALLRLARRERPLDHSESNGQWAWTFNHTFSRTTHLQYQGEASPEWIEVTLSNNRVLRYCSKACGAGVSTWKDVSGRTRVWPVTLISRDLASEEWVHIGADFVSHAGSIIDTVRITKIAAPVAFSHIALAKRFISPSGSESRGIVNLAREFPLKKIDQPASIEDGHVQTWEYIAPSPDGACCAVSSFDGNVYVIDAQTSAVIWRYGIPDGTVSTIAWSRDGQSLLAGEHSADGYIYCFNGGTGRLLWKYRTANDVGSLENTLLVGGRWAGVVKPNAREIVVGADSLAYARARRSRYFEVNGEREKQNISRLYCMNIRTADTEWVFPPDSNLLDVSSSIINASDDGRYVSWAYFDYETKTNPVIMVFDARSGKMLWRYQTNTVEKFFSSSTGYSGLSFSWDSHYGAIALNDGRVFVFDNAASVASGTGVVYKELNMTPPIEAGTVPVMTYMTKSSFTRNGDIIALTGNTYTTPFASTKVPPVYHPHASSVFCFTIDGELRWRFTAGGNPSDLALSSGPRGEYLVLPCAHNIRSKDYNEHGFYLFEVTGDGGGFSRIKSFYHTNGICVNAVLSPSQQRVFAVEAPIDMDDSIRERLEGEHRILFFDFEPVL
jgi:outer membrane protein assembly factor BamB